MKKKRITRTTEVHIETEEFVAIKTSRHNEFVWCGNCQRRVQMATADEAAQLAQVSLRTIYRWIEAGKVHFSETGAGLLSICLFSLSHIASRTSGGTPEVGSSQAREP